MLEAAGAQKYTALNDALSSLTLEQATLRLQ
jgi:hypothetical protein